jgi:predicted DNA-binding transcriptional regulator YafY
VLGFGGSAAPTRVRLAFRDGAGDHLLESPLADDQQATRGPDGTLRVTATVQDTERLRWWLLGFGARVAVLGPLHSGTTSRRACAPQSAMTTAR